MLIIALIAVFGCLIRPTTPPPQVLMKPISAAISLERGWPELDVPPWEPTNDLLEADLLEAEVALASLKTPTNAETLTGALDALAIDLKTASCAANDERPELEEAALVLEQGQLVLELGATDMTPDMLRLVAWMRSNLEGPAAACGASPRASSPAASTPSTVSDG